MSTVAMTEILFLFSPPYYICKLTRLKLEGLACSGELVLCLSISLSWSSYTCTSKTNHLQFFLPILTDGPIVNKINIVFDVKIKH